MEDFQEVLLLKEVFDVMGVKVVGTLEKVVNFVTAYYAVSIGGEGIDVFGSEEFARKVYEDCKAQAMKGPVDGKYFFLSDKDREDALAEYRRTPWYEEGK